jgi:uncharacterized protein with GYD domain
VRWPHAWRGENERWEDVMPKYMFLARYSVEGAKGLVKEGGSGRREALKKMFEGLGGKFESLHFAFGDVDAFVIGELPDNVAAAAALALGQSGAGSCKTTVLITPEEMDKASKKTVAYRAPGH